MSRTTSQQGAFHVKKMLTISLVHAYVLHSACKPDSIFCDLARGTDLLKWVVGEGVTLGGVAC